MAKLVRRTWLQNCCIPFVVVNLSKHPPSYATLLSGIFFRLTISTDMKRLLLFLGALIIHSPMVINKETTIPPVDLSDEQKAEKDTIIKNCLDAQKNPKLEKIVVGDLNGSSPWCFFVIKGYFDRLNVYGGGISSQYWFKFDDALPMCQEHYEDASLPVLRTREQTIHIENHINVNNACRSGPFHAALDVTKVSATIYIFVT